MSCILAEDWLVIANTEDLIFTTQEKYAKKTGIETNTPEVISRAVHEITDQMTKVFEFNKIVQTVFDASKQK